MHDLGRIRIEVLFVMSSLLLIKMVAMDLGICFQPIFKLTGNNKTASRWLLTPLAQ